MFQWFTATRFIWKPRDASARRAPVLEPPAPQNRSAIRATRVFEGPGSHCICCLRLIYPGTARRAAPLRAGASDDRSVGTIERVPIVCAVRASQVLVCDIGSDVHRPAHE